MLFLVPDYSIKKTLSSGWSLAASRPYNHDWGSLRLKLAISREFKADITPLPPPPLLLPRPDKASQQSTSVQRILSLANQPGPFKELGMTNLTQTHDQWDHSPESLTDHSILSQYPLPRP